MARTPIHGVLGFAQENGNVCFQATPSMVGYKGEQREGPPIWRHRHIRIADRNRVPSAERHFVRHGDGNKTALGYVSKIGGRPIGACPSGSFLAPRYQVPSKNAKHTNTHTHTHVATPPRIPPIFASGQFRNTRPMRAKSRTWRCLAHSCETVRAARGAAKFQHIS